ncbi:amidohydrolase [Streptomyces sp. SID9124]|uniref:amidohydrolase n=1 Tax=Streptomyces sp. SID9124 TaxID=2706108 RepID=UPI0013DF3756|nr:amidohydrolase [Streptomyces sp. SID9124]NED14596.1 amidohydrolase [Streptomyces sp. SID9124]
MTGVKPGLWLTGTSWSDDALLALIRVGAADAPVGEGHAESLGDLAPFIQPTLDTAVSAMTVGALAWLGH